MSLDNIVAIIRRRILDEARCACGVDIDKVKDYYGCCRSVGRPYLKGVDLDQITVDEYIEALPGVDILRSTFGDLKKVYVERMKADYERKE